MKKEEMKELSITLEDGIVKKIERVFLEYDKYWEDDDFDFTGYGYKLDELYSELNKANKDIRFEVLEELIHKYLKLIPSFNINDFEKDIRMIDNYVGIFETRKDDQEVIEESDFLVNSVIYKLNNDKGIKISLPINIKYLLEYGLSAKMDTVKIEELLKKMALKLMVVKKYYNEKKLEK